MNRRSRILVHVIFWSVMLVSTGLETIPSIGRYSSGEITFDYLIYLLSRVFFFYIYYLFITKEHLAKKGSVLLILYGLLFVIIISLPVTYIHIYFVSNKVFDLSGKKYLFAFGRQYFSFLQTNIMFAMFGSLLKLTFLWYENVMKQKETEKQNITGELALLRTQINPRFLANSLRHIKLLIEKQPDKAIYSIENLSEIMSYVLYETSSEKVPIEDEINYISNYLNLQKVRFNPEYIKFEINGDTAGVAVPPLLFMPFLENTFKASAETDESPGIIITLNIHNNNLLFRIINYATGRTGNSLNEEAFDTSSIRRFLDLQFGNNYTIETTEENNKNQVSLKVSLS